MPDATFSTTSSPGRILLAATALVAVLCGAPRTTHPGLTRGLGSQPAVAGELLTLVTSLHLDKTADTAPPAPDRHALRAAVAPYSVRLAVDKNAVHPLSGPVAVRHDDRLGSLGRPLRLISLAPFDPPAPPPQPPAPQVAVKNATPAPATVAAPPPPPAKPQALASAPPGRSILVAGDSLSIYLADALRPLLAGRPGTTFTARGKISSGLARPDFFNWEREMAAAAAAAKPDTVVVMIATNDNQTLTRPDGKKVAFDRPGWNAEYARRVRRLVELARTGNPHARIYWVGAPVMANPRLNSDVAAINAVIAKQIAQLPGCRYVDVWRTLADGSGHFTQALPTPRGPRTARTPDGVHLTSYGAKLLANAALSAMSPTVAELDQP